MPKPTSILLASRCAASLAEVDDLLCLAAVGIIPKEVFSGVHPGTAQLIPARDEVRVAFEAARRTAPRVIGTVALNCSPLSAKCTRWLR